MFNSRLYKNVETRVDEDWSGKAKEEEQYKVVHDERSWGGYQVAK